MPMRNIVLVRGSKNLLAFFVLFISLLHGTTPDLHITAGIITTEFVRTGSDVLSLPVMSLKMEK